MSGRGIRLIAEDCAESEIRGGLGGGKRHAVNGGFVRGGGFFCGDHAHARAEGVSASFPNAPQLPSGLFSCGQSPPCETRSVRLLAAILSVVFFAAQLHAAGKSSAKASAKVPTEKEKAKASAAEAVFQDHESLAKLQAMDMFPEMEIENSEFANAVSVEVECLECENPAYFKSSAWPLHVARKVAVRMGIKPLSIAQIRKRVAENFEVDAEAFQQVHGIQILSARLKLADEVFDATPQLAGTVNERGFTVDCDGSLLATLTDITQFARGEDEAKADYWKRQQKLLAAVANAQVGQESLEIKFEFHSEAFTAAAKSGERIVISEDGKVSISKIAPAAHVVRATDPVAAPKTTSRRSAKESRIGGGKK